MTVKKIDMQKKNVMNNTKHNNLKKHIKMS